ncbi:hypothetical protein GGS23DRAFT_382100 [Durotheca rogersii]|uniref:uncharacterized protein n=1 Tax=Durotheca rogersii TaxID=419775 RepID=UPI00221FCD65|nr:uncharacterized protein GGS23DRAFT_382100 [Durotheca rogersii]KAI5866325.1 hypothetical protein GGS23DRAFT_382100 [Durotheca rogersii]
MKNFGSILVALATAASFGIALPTRPNAGLEARVPGNYVLGSRDPRRQGASASAGNGTAIIDSDTANNGTGNANRGNNRQGKLLGNGANDNPLSRLIGGGNNTSDDNADDNADDASSNPLKDLLGGGNVGNLLGNLLGGANGDNNNNPLADLLNGGNLADLLSGNSPLGNLLGGGNNANSGNSLADLLNGGNAGNLLGNLLGGANGNNGNLLGQLLGGGLGNLLNSGNRAAQAKQGNSADQEE